MLKSQSLFLRRQLGLNAIESGYEAQQDKTGIPILNLQQGHLTALFECWTQIDAQDDEHKNGIYGENNEQHDQLEAIDVLREGLGQVLPVHEVIVMDP